MTPIELKELIKNKSHKLCENIEDTAIVLAAGHGKRIKSNTSKMMHKIWGKPTVQRVSEAVSKSFECNLVIVVGVKADQVVNSISEKVQALFAYQEVQNGTGHAVQIALDELPDNYKKGNVYVLPGDMGLIDYGTILDFKKAFNESDSDMMVLTGLYEGEPHNNHYGRIIRVPELDASGNPSGNDKGKVIEIMEFKDIVALNDNNPYMAEYLGKKYLFTREDLLKNNEFNSGVFAYKFEALNKFIYQISNNNVQKEIYLTDLIDLFNKAGLKVGAVSPESQHVLMGFNNKSVLWEMNQVAKKLIYEKLKDVITIEDPNDFYIADEVIENLLLRDSEGEIIDLVIGRGVYIDENVSLGQNITIGKEVKLIGEITIGDNCILGDFSSITGKYSLKNNSIVAPFSVIKPG